MKLLFKQRLFSWFDLSWKLQDEGNTLGNAIFGTLTDSPLETSDSEDENISADTDKQTDDNTSTESSSN